MNVRGWTPRQDNPPDYEPKPKDKPTHYNMERPKVGYQEVYTPEDKRFRFAHVLKPGFDFSPLVPFCERIVYSTDGYGDTVPNLREQLEETMQRFDADKDVLIPVGSATICILAATLLVRIMMSNGKRWDSYAMGVYTEGGYQFWRVPLDANQEAYDIILR